ncbi:MBL fold metallo-hydrolase [Gellertiella hungarica]|uniref:Glyoxylase-like metal-dependent hydrolase (Beta-lactamase superfamily II) n=1 Tax=Gellertiella hungarica TaxID=1572859 RepID=A0A7W6J401_9HYPH|nr:MBL fold metallo-hydrolase [Gellertiella hungarica]MBB4064396.1 glyoxylase-like metal-dependent hydrolase (beta-lactamase superfamily II) [Gellertiella hungarica]
MAGEQDVAFDRAFTPAYGEAVPVAPGVERITVNNPSPFTFHGTNTYIVGRDSVCVIDPGPEDEAHFAALMRALAGRRVSHIAVSHTHRDHSPLAARLKAATGAATAAEGPHRPARPLHDGETNPFAESSDTGFQPDIVLGEGDVIEGDGWTLSAILTPGHTANHAAFALEGTGIVFSADHVMAWATSIVAPPDGAMADYMASLERLLERDDRLYLPGHGGPVNEPQAFLRGLRTHRRMRERAVLERIRAGDRFIPEMVKAIYRDTDPRLHGAAALSVLAHLEDLTEKGRVITGGPPRLSGEYRPGPDI